MAGMHRDHFGDGRRRFGGGDYGLGCPYNQPDSWPYTCNY
jgi:hypothetical protein